MHQFDGTGPPRRSVVPFGRMLQSVSPVSLLVAIAEPHPVRACASVGGGATLPPLRCISLPGTPEPGYVNSAVEPVSCFGTFYGLQSPQRFGISAL